MAQSTNVRLARRFRRRLVTGFRLLPEPAAYFSFSPNTCRNLSSLGPMMYVQ
jgi:hypothetical protein